MRCVIGLIINDNGILELIRLLLIIILQLILEILIIVFFVIITFLGLEGFLRGLASEMFGLTIGLTIEVGLDFLESFLVLKLEFLQLLRRLLL
jgi:hypothetical protein